MATIIGYVPGVRNLCHNPGWETGISGYGGTNATVNRTTTLAWEGQYSGTFTVSSIASAPRAWYGNNAADTRRVVLAAGEPLSFKGRIRHSRNGVSIRPYVEFRSAADAVLSTLFGTAVVVSNTAFTPISLEDLTAPASTAYARVGFEMVLGAGLAVSDIMYLDGMDIRKSDSVTSYVAGNQGIDYTWIGTAHDSPSDRAAKPIYGAAGRGGQILIEPKLYKADRYNNIGEDISTRILSGFVEMRTDREIKMQFKGTLIGVNPVLAYTDYLAPFMRLSYPDGSEVYEQIGLYSIAPPGEEWNEEYVTGSFQGYDLTWNLADSSFGIPFTVAAGTNIVSSMRTILNNEGLTRWNIPDNSATFTTARTWQTDKSKLAILNDHAEAIGYYTYHADRTGNLRSFSYNDLDNAEPAVTLFSGQGSTVVGRIKRERSTEGIINMVRVLKEGAADGTISYTQTNSNPLSPVSTTKLGRIKFKEIKVKDLASLAVAKDIARRALRDAASVYTKYQITTLPDPSRNVWEIYDTLIYMKDGTEVISGKVRCTGWDIGFTPTSAGMVHYCSRLEPYE